VTGAQIRHVAGAVEIFRGKAPIEDLHREALPSPGVGLRHYAPRARLVLVEAPLPELGLRLAEAAAHLPGDRLGVMLPSEVAAPARAATVFPWGRWSEPAEMACNLYAGLRALDAEGCSVILCPMPPAEGIGTAIRDRLRKAAHPSSASGGGRK
jgi:L-threonylcarbamoyladenylate synthase